MIASLLTGLLHAAIYMAITAIGLGLSVLLGAWLVSPFEQEAP